MKSLREKLKVRLKKDRPMTTISIRIPEDLIEDLKEIAPLRGFSGYQPLVRSYIGQGLRRDEMRFGSQSFVLMTETMKRHGVPDEVIEEVIAETIRKTA